MVVPVDSKGADGFVASTVGDVVAVGFTMVVVAIAARAFFVNWSREEALTRLGWTGISWDACNCCGIQRMVRRGGGGGCFCNL